MRHLHCRVAALAAAIPLLSCSDSTSPAAPASVRFNYHAAAAGFNGTFAADGSLDLNSDQFETGAIAIRAGANAPDIELIATNSDKLQEFGFDLVSVSGPGLFHTCEITQTQCVAFGQFWVDFDDVYYFGMGAAEQPPDPEVTITVTEMTSNRLKGTFQGIALGVGGDTLTITGGTFDVPLVRP